LPGLIVQTVARMLEVGLLIWFAALATLIAVRVLSGDIEVSGFLTHSKSADTVLPERVIAMTAVSTIVVGYVLHALQSGVQGELPDIPNAVLSLLTGSNSVYLAGKIARN
jgi:hypothetical protein